MNIIELNNEIKIRNQFPNKPNLLTKELMTATGFDEKDAFRIQSSVCKAITFWFEGYYKKYLTMDFPTYYKYCIDQNFIRKEDAWLFLEYGFYDGRFSTQMAEKFGISAIGFNNFAEFNKWADAQSDYVGTLRIINAKGNGKHSLLTYKEKKKKYISDTSSRGVGVDFASKITEKNFIYFTCMTGKK